MTMKKCYLVKFLDKKWADRMLDGELLFRAVEGFCDASKRNAESNYKFHGDWFGGINYTDGDQHGIIDVLTLREKIFCLSTLEFDEQSNHFIIPDKRMRRFGDTAVIIHDPIEFLHRTCNSMVERYDHDFWTSFGAIHYNVDLTQKQTYDVFCKAKEYEYQKEFRIALDLANGKFHPSILKNVTDFAKLTFPGEIIEDTNPESVKDELILNIGDVRDICISISTSELLQGEYRKIFTPPVFIKHMIIPRKPMPTFFKMVANLP